MTHGQHQKKKGKEREAGINRAHPSCEKYGEKGNVL